MGHPTKLFLEYCKADWDRYHEMFRKNCKGCADKSLEYPYTYDMITEWFKEYNDSLGFNISPEGPTEDFKKSTIDVFKNNDDMLNREILSGLVKETKLVKNLKAGDDPLAQA